MRASIKLMNGSLAPSLEKVLDHHFYLKEGVKGYEICE